MPEYLKTPDELAKFGIETTGKIMGNGEKRARVRAFGVTTHVTVGLADRDLGWQDTHYHQGLDEVYVVAEGSIAIAKRDHLSIFFEVKTYGRGGVVSLPAKCEHNVYVFAGASFFTNVFGTSVGNPDRGGNDWYPASTGFEEWVKKRSLLDMKGRRDYR